MDIKILADNEEVYEVYLNGERTEKLEREDGSRQVFFAKNHVVKLDRSGNIDGTNQSQRENSLWKKVKKCHAKLFVPILEYKSLGKWKAVVQPKIDFVYESCEEVENHPDYDIVTDILVSEYAIMDTWDGWNLGITKDNRLVCFDYGI